MKIKVTGFYTEHTDLYLLQGEVRGIPKSWVQLTETAEIELIEINKDIVFDTKLQNINKQIEEENGKHYAEIKRLEQKKQELLAITYESEAMKQDYNDAN